MTDRTKPKFTRCSDTIEISDHTWLDLGQLRKLVALADERGWPDSALLSHSSGTNHLTRHDVRIAHRIVIEGNDPDPRQE